MAGNQHGGKNYKRNKKGSSQPKELMKKTDEQEYGRVIKKLGDRRFLLIPHNKKEKIMGKARKSLRAGHLITEGSIVLYSVRDFQDNMVDIIANYTNDDVRKLKREKEITDPKFTDVEYDETIQPETEEIEIAEQPQRNYDLSSDEEDVDIDDL